MDIIIPITINIYGNIYIYIYKYMDSENPYKMYLEHRIYVCVEMQFYLNSYTVMICYTNTTKM